ncbi:MAG: hypothetical protein WCH43_00765, partial [Verrucomicrobiota bacterium]
SWSEATFDEKAFSVLTNAGMILIPVSSYDPQTGMASEVQIIDLGHDSLTSRGVISQPFWPRRATLFSNRILSISGRELLTVDATNQDLPKVTSDVALSWTVDRVFLSGDYIVQVENGVDWYNQSGPTLRVAYAGDPDTILAETTINGDPILGATVKDGLLYIAQAASRTGFFFSTGTVSKTPLTVTAYSLSNLPQLAVTGSASHLINPPGWNPVMNALWPAAGVLVWEVNDQASWPIYYINAGSTVSAAPGLNLSAAVVDKTGVGSLSSISNMRLFPPFWGGNSSLRLFAFDVSNPQAPAFLSETQSPSGGWSTGAAFAGDHVIFASHMGSHQFDNFPWKWIARSSESKNSGWAQGWFLDAIDYSSPASPIVRDPVSLPGELIGISAANPGSAVLYSRNWTSPNNSSYGLYLNACAYDGAAAWLVDSVTFDGWSFSATVSQGNVYVGRPTGTTGTSGSVEIWTLSNAGKMTNISTSTMDEPVWGLRLVNDLLVAQLNDAIQLFDMSNPATLTNLVRSSLPTWGDLGGADGDSQNGLWVPLNDYGVWVIQP